MELPRLTGALRAFSGLSGDAGSQHVTPDDLRLELVSKRLARSKLQSEEGLSWPALMLALRKHATTVSYATVSNSLSDLISCAREIGKFLFFVFFKR